jgi:cysteine desulfurase/selenocysteine lyase
MALETSTITGIEVDRIRQDFPMLGRSLHGKPLLYLDNAGSSLKPRSVLDRHRNFYEFEYANTNEENSLSQNATKAVADVRSSIANLLGASSPDEIVFLRSATEAVNLVAYAFERSQLQAGDEIVVTEMEHDSNFLPWQIACERSGAKLRIAAVARSGELDLDGLEKLLSERTKMIAVAHVSNVFGTIYPVAEIGAIAKGHGIPFFVDGAQAAPHLPVDVAKIGCDFYGFSAHKMGGPTGVGVLYGRREWLEKLPPYQVGGVMVSSLSATSHEWKPVPKKFEAGTEAIAEIVAFGPAVKYWSELGLENIEAAERRLVQYATDRLRAIPGIEIIGVGSGRVSIVSLNAHGMKPQDVEVALDREGIIVRSGTLNARILMRRLGLPGAVRAAFMFYNTEAECDRLCESLRRLS